MCNYFTQAGTASVWPENLMALLTRRMINNYSIMNFDQAYTSVIRNQLGYSRLGDVALI